MTTEYQIFCNVIYNYQLPSGKICDIDELKRFIELMDFDDIYKISIQVKKQYERRASKYVGFYEHNFYVADSIQTDTQILNYVRTKYPDDVQHHQIPVDKPAILTDIVDDVPVAPGLVMNPYTYETRNGSSSKHIFWRELNPKKDIVINRNLHQIYPENTGKYPTVIEKLLQKKR